MRISEVCGTTTSSPVIRDGDSVPPGDAAGVPGSGRGRLRPGLVLGTPASVATAFVMVRSGERDASRNGAIVPRPNELSQQEWSDGVNEVLHPPRSAPGDGECTNSVTTAARGGECGVREPNDLLRTARLRRPPEFGSGPMSRVELANALNGMFPLTGREYSLDANYVGKFERGVIRWPHSDYREALRTVLGVATDAELGLRLEQRR